MISSPFIHNAAYIEGLLEDYLTDPSRVNSEWQDYFLAMGYEPYDYRHAPSALEEEIDDDTIDVSMQRNRDPLSFDYGISTGANGVLHSSEEKYSTLPHITNNAVQDSLRALMMIRNYRVRGHLYADLDPLKLEKRPYYRELDPLSYGFDEHHKNLIFMDGLFGFDYATGQQIVERLEKIYCGTIGVEFMHIQDPERRQWIQESVESIPFVLTPSQKKSLLKDLVRAELFEKFLHTKFQGAKRFGLDGGESLIPALEFAVQHICDQGIKHLVLGMAHRGRLNVITNILEQPFRKLFAKFLATKEDPYAIGSGDVKYHLGYSSDRSIHDYTLHLSLMANPSHLEAVNPVALGKVRCEQYHLRDENRDKVMAILIHGDAAFAGQGLVAETLELSDLAGYRTGGAIHVIINNQIGFTTSPPHSRSSPYCSDGAKIIQAPILHVNGDDPEAVLRVVKIAVDYRAKFHQDIVIDLICYRRYGHNEADEPSFTQPIMYKTIKEQPSTATLYARKLLEEGILLEQDISEIYANFQEVLDEEYHMALEGEDCFDQEFWLKGAWQNIEAAPYDEFMAKDEVSTGVTSKTLQEVGEAIFKVPSDISVNSKIIRQLEAKQKMLESGKGFDWATAEALAFGTLLHEGHHVRLSGQDCGRGTFSQRHAVLVDQHNEEKYIPLDHIHSYQPLFEPVDSPLAEASVLGFEYGYSIANPNNLVLWEGQFGDFANGAQVMIDQFLSAGEMKWARQSGLVLLLPHGFEGQGPEHSSARLERFLQLCAEGNWCVANCSTPSNYFHILRRQLKKNYRKPLILMTPKSLLRHKLCVSSISDFESSFKPVIMQDYHPKDIKRVVLCSGKIYYDLAEEMEKHSHVAIIRLEQYYPWPQHALMEALAPYKDAEFVWCQEEPENMGAWHFIDRRLEDILKRIQARLTRPFVIARSASASPATGNLKRHQKEQHDIIQAVFSKTLFHQQLKTLSAVK